MIQVCDAIMGSGKSSAAITYMNEHKSEKFIYITPYLDEVERVKTSCKGMRFIEPSEKIAEYHFKKCEHTAALINKGRNIATTHQAFKRYTSDMLDDIRKHGYTLIIDENIDFLERYDIHPDDLQLAIESGLIKSENGSYCINRDDYHGTAFRELFRFLKTRNLVDISDSDSSDIFYWILPADLLLSFKDVFVLTYMFEGQSLHHYLHMSNVPYKYIGVKKYEDGNYRFTDFAGYVPDYVKDLDSMIHIIDNERMNSVGDNKNALSMNWFNTKDDLVLQLKNNTINCMNNMWKGVPPSQKLWGTYSGSRHLISSKGYIRSFLTFNAKATNDYRKRDHLVYLANIFMNVSEKIYYRNHGIEVDDNLYALSIMLQWIWRSAIRDGKEIYLYIPSSRMRNLLIDWINKVSKGGEAHAA